MITYFVEMKNPIKVKVIGHANYGSGFDAVCGMVSVLTQSALEGCKMYGNAKYKIDETEGKLDFECEHNKATRGIIYSMICGLKAIEGEFPEYLKEGGGNNAELRNT